MNGHAAAQRYGLHAGLRGEAGYGRDFRSLVLLLSARQWRNKYTRSARTSRSGQRNVPSATPSGAVRTIKTREEVHALMVVACQTFVVAYASSGLCA